MNFKILLLSPLLFTNLLLAEVQKQNPCLDKEKMQKKIAKLSTNRSKNWLVRNIIKLGLFGQYLKKREQFQEKFSSLSEQEQQAKVETWLANESRTTKMLYRCQKASEFFNNKKTDDEALEKLTSFQQEIVNDTLKDEFLCCACGELIMPYETMSNEDKKFLHELEIKHYFYELKKSEELKSGKTEEEIIRFEERKKQLKRLEKEALENFEPYSCYSRKASQN